MKLQNYVAGRWVEGDGSGTPLLHAVNGEEVALATADGIDFQQMVDHARRVGGPALRRMTFHQRARMLKAMALYLSERKDDFYTLSGIYFAEGPMDSDCTAMEPMYHRMADAVRARDAQAYLAVGTRFCPTYITFFDMMVQFARDWNEYQTDYAPPSWMPANSPQRFVHFVHSVPPSDASAALSRAVANGAGWVFITDQSDPNPWSVLPSYFSEELATMRSVQ